MKSSSRPNGAQVLSPKSPNHFGFCKIWKNPALWATLAQLKAQGSRRRGVAQLVARSVRVAEAGSSSLLTPTKIRSRLYRGLILFSAHDYGDYLLENLKLLH